MEIKETRLWGVLVDKAQNVSNAAAILCQVEALCGKALPLLNRFADTFPTYTLHNETHVMNVLSIMADLLGEAGLGRLTLGEAAMLILAACYHDIGMVYTPGAEGGPPAPAGVSSLPHETSTGLQRGLWGQRRGARQRSPVVLP